MNIRDHQGKNIKDFFVCNDGPKSGDYVVSDGKKRVRVAGVFRKFDKAQQWISDNEWQTKAPTVVEGKVEDLFMSCYERWSGLKGLKAYLKSIGGRLFIGKRAESLLNNGKPGYSICWLKNLLGSPWEDCKFPVVVIFPEEVALKIVALGYIP